MKTIIVWGQSNAEGQGSLNTVPAATLERWTGSTTVPLTALPANVRCPGIYYWTPRLPYGTSTQYAVDNYPAANQVDLASAPPGLTADRWIWVNGASTGEGQYRRVTAVAGDVLTVAPNWSPTPTGTSTVRVLESSESVLAASTTTLQKTAATAAWVVNAYTGKWVTIISGSGAGQSRRIVSNTADTLTLDVALTLVPVANDGFEIQTGTNSVNSIDDYQSLGANAGAFRPLTFYYDIAESFTTGFEYPNFRSMPLPSPLAYTTNTLVSHDLELAWNLQHELADDLFVIKVAISSAYSSRFLGSLPNTNFAWYRNSVHNDWHPASTDTETTTPVYDLFDALTVVTLGAAKAWVAANRPGDSIEIVGIFGIEGESDSVTVERAQLAETNFRLIRDTMRTRIKDLGLCSTDARKIPFILCKHRTPFWTYAADYTNPAFDRLAADDLYTGVIETAGLTVNVDGAHWDTAALITIGRRFYEKWVEIVQREKTALQPAVDLLTLADLRTLVLRRYERQDVSNDATKLQVRTFLNDSIREIRNTLGHKAWFLRRVETMTVTAGPGAVITLPRVVRRLYRVASSNNPKRPIDFGLVGHAEEGKLQIVCKEALTGTTYLHHIVMPRDLVEDADVCLVPQEYVEWVVMLTCKRLSEAAGNQTLVAYYDVEVERLARWIKRDCQRYQAMSGESLFVYDDIETDDWSPQVRAY